MNVHFSKAIELVDRTQNRQPCGEVFFSANPDRFHHAIKHFAVVDLHHITAARNAERFDSVRRHHAHLGIGSG